MAPRQHDVVEIILQMGMIIRGLVGREQQHDLDWRDVAGEMRHLEARCDLLLREQLDERDRMRVLVNQLRQRLDDEIERRERAERARDALAREIARWWDGSSEAEARRMLAEVRRWGLDDSSGAEALATIIDTQVCPECGGEHLVARRDDVFDCCYCGQSFRLDFSRR